MEKALKLLGRELKIIGADSISSSSSSMDYLPGELLTIMKGKSIALFQEERMIKGTLEN